MSSRKWFLFLIGFALVGCCAISSLAAGMADRVRLMRGSESGEVSDTTPLEVTLNKGESNSRTIQVNQIKSIAFEGEPAELRKPA